MSKQFSAFLLRWVLNSFGLWIAARILHDHGIIYDQSQGFALFFFAGLTLSVMNVLIKPLIIILSLPAILFTLGLFTLVVNGFMVYLVAKLTPGITISFWSAVVAGMIVSLINYVLTSLLDIRKGNFINER